MENKKNIFWLFFSLCFFVSCASLKKEPVDLATGIGMDSRDKALFQSAFKDIGKENYSSAIPVLEKLAKKYRRGDLEWVVTYNLAVAYKESGKCEKTTALYPTLISHTKKQPHLRLQVYLLMSYIYECLGLAEKALFVLKEGEKYLPYLMEEDTRLIEYPARLFLAYIRAGEDKTGLKIQKQLYENLEMKKKAFRISSSADKNFAGYFYIIGRPHIRSDKIQLQSFLKMSYYYQAYLTQSVLLKAGDWSVKAEQELGHLYRKIWTSLKKQKNKNAHKKEIKKLLNQLKNIARSSKNKKMLVIYANLRKKTFALLSPPLKKNKQLKNKQLIKTQKP